MAYGFRMPGGVHKFISQDTVVTVLESLFRTMAPLLTGLRYSLFVFYRRCYRPTICARLIEEENGKHQLI